ncbi:hypothetical protein RhiirA5_493033 [Rhizophagus irregularis]|uniref:Uncharacterized protein n=1 Tax=Rhizophagus irregularis TaxID=588596 RepID=A0A2N0QE70_9GLOM|nr:hypothetical protein RhiirA5_493033 [Rhizophagus irregularis]
MVLLDIKHVDELKYIIFYVNYLVSHKLTHKVLATKPVSSPSTLQLTLCEGVNGKLMKLMKASKIRSILPTTSTTTPQGLVVLKHTGSDLLEETNFMSRFDPNILINGEQTESSSRSSTPNSYRKIEPEIMRRLMNDGKVNNTGIDMKGLELAPTGQ